MTKAWKPDPALLRAEDKIEQLEASALKDRAEIERLKEQLQERRAARPKSED